MSDPVAEKAEVTINRVDRQIAIQRNVLLYVGVHEDGPPFANRGVIVDHMNQQGGAPLGSPWCASAAAAVWRAMGCVVPPTNAASCEAWRQWLKATRRWVTLSDPRGPVVGDVVLYDFTGENVAHHMGVVFEVLADRFLVGEGNTSASPTDREGWVYLLKERRFTDPGIVGYGSPDPRS
jgi:CHAP domain